MRTDGKDLNGDTGAGGAQDGLFRSVCWYFLIIIFAGIPIALVHGYLHRTLSLHGSSPFLLAGFMPLILTASYTAPKKTKTLGIVTAVSVVSGSFALLLAAFALSHTQGFWLEVLGISLPGCIAVGINFLAFRWLGVLSWNLPPKHQA